MTSPHFNDVNGLRWVRGTVSAFREQYELLIMPGKFFYHQHSPEKPVTREAKYHASIALGKKAIRGNKIRHNSFGPCFNANGIVKGTLQFPEDGIAQWHFRL
jgi:hypothetical protein